jgi:hypothetical protein
MQYDIGSDDQYTQRMFGMYVRQQQVHQGCCTGSRHPTVCVCVCVQRLRLHMLCVAAPQGRSSTSWRPSPCSGTTMDTLPAPPRKPGPTTWRTCGVVVRLWVWVLSVGVGVGRGNVTYPRCRVRGRCATHAPPPARSSPRLLPPSDTRCHCRERAVACPPAPVHTTASRTAPCTSLC